MFIELHKVPILCRYTLSPWVLLLEHFWNPRSVCVLWRVAVGCTYNAVWGTSSTVTSFVNLLHYTPSHSKPIITFFHLFVISRMNLSLNKHLLFPCQLGYIVQTVAPTACLTCGLSKCTVVFFCSYSRMYFCFSLFLPYLWYADIHFSYFTIII